MISEAKCGGERRVSLVEGIGASRAAFFKPARQRFTLTRHANWQRGRYKVWERYSFVIREKRLRTVNIRILALYDVQRERIHYAVVVCAFALSVRHEPSPVVFQPMERIVAVTHETLPRLSPCFTIFALHIHRSAAHAALPRPSHRGPGLPAWTHRHGKAWPRRLI